jgi:hypothetical protein
MQQFSKKINLYSMVKSYFSVFLMFILYTFGYSAINNPSGAEEFINSIMSFSPEIKILSITGALLLFLILIYEKLYSQESSSQNSSSSIKGNASTASDVPLSTLQAGAELPDYNSSALMNSQPVSTPPVISSSVVSITTLELDPHHLYKLELDSKENKFNILKQMIPEALFCSLIAGIAILSCSLVIDALIKGQQLLPTILEFTNSMSSFLGISSSALLTIAFAPMVALTIFSILSNSPIHTQDNKGHILERNQSIEAERVRSNSLGKGVELKTRSTIDKVSHKNRCENDWRKDSTNPFSENYNSQPKQNHNSDRTNPIHQKVNNDDWRKDTTNPFSENYNCTNLTIERFSREPEKALY